MDSRIGQPLEGVMQPGDSPQLSDGFRFMDALLRQNIEAQVRTIQEGSKAQQDRSLKEFEGRILALVRTQIDAFRQELRADIQLQKDVNIISSKQVEDLEQRMQTLQNRVQALTSHDHLSKMQDNSMISMMQKQIDEIRVNLGKEIDARVQERLQEMVQFAPETTDVELPLAPVGAMYEHQEQKQSSGGPRTRTSTASSLANTSTETATNSDQIDSQLPPAVHNITVKQCRPADAFEEILASDITVQAPLTEDLLAIAATKVDAPQCSEGKESPVIPDIVPVEQESSGASRVLPTSPLSFSDGDRWLGTANERSRPNSRRSMWKRKRVRSVVMAVFLFALLLGAFRPYLTSSVILLLVLWCFYLFAEDQTIKIVSNQISETQSDSWKKILSCPHGFLKRVKGYRSSHEDEQAFQTYLGTLTALLILLNPDVSCLLTYIWSLNGFGYSNSLPLMVFAALILSTHRFVCFMVTRLHKRPEMRRRVSGGMDSSDLNDEAKEAIKEITQCLRNQQSRKKKESQSKIYDVFAESEPDLLNTVVHAVPLEQVLSFFGDTSTDNARSIFLEMLCKERGEDLTTRSKFILLNALCCMKISSCAYGENAVQDLLLSCLGDGLSELKSMQDGGGGTGSIHTMHKIIYNDIQKPEVRKIILDHFLQESIAQVGQRTLMANVHFQKLLNRGKKYGCLPEHFGFVEQSMDQYNGVKCQHSWLKIFTDIDDTLECSGGRWPAGIDSRYAKHTPYPGVTAFYRELQGGGDVGQLVALSARPHVYGHVVEDSVLNKFLNLKKNHGLHCIPALLTGAVDSSVKFFATGGDEDGLDALGTKKYENIVEYLKLYPEFRLIFIGDNGQADYAVGKKICAEFPQYVEQVWIHEVWPREKTYAYDAGLSKDVPLRFIRNYIEAAIHASTRPNPLITPDGLRRVVATAVEDFKRIEHWPSKDHRNNEAQALNKSINESLHVLRGFGIKGDIELLEVSKDEQLSSAKDSRAEYQSQPQSPKPLPHTTKFGWPFGGRKEQPLLASPERSGQQNLPVVIPACPDIKQDDASSSPVEQQTSSRFSAVFAKRRQPKESKDTAISADGIPEAALPENNAVDKPNETGDTSNSGATGSIITRITTGLMGRGATGQQTHPSPSLTAAQSPTLPAIIPSEAPALPNLLEADDLVDTSGVQEVVIDPSAVSPLTPTLGNSLGSELSLGPPLKEVRSLQAETSESGFAPSASTEESIGKPGAVQSVKAWVSNSIGNLVGSGPSKKLASALSPRAGGEPVIHELGRAMTNSSFASIATVPSNESIYTEDDEHDTPEKQLDGLAAASIEQVQAEATSAYHTEEQADVEATNLSSPQAIVAECARPEPAAEHNFELPEGTGEDVKPESIRVNDAVTLTPAPETKTCISTFDSEAVAKDNVAAIGNGDGTKNDSLSSSIDPVVTRASEDITVPPSQTVSEKDSPLVATSQPDTSLQDSPIMLAVDLAEDSAKEIERTMEDAGTSSSEKASLQPLELPS